MRYIEMGSRVTLDIGGHGILYTYQIVSEKQENPVLGKIANTSQLAQSLMGRKVGERLFLKTPLGQSVQVLIEEIHGYSRQVRR